MSLIAVDVASDGPVPPKYSMVSFGAVVVEPSLSLSLGGGSAPSASCGSPSPWR